MESVFLRPQNDFEELLGTQYFEVTCHPVVRQLRSRDSLILFITKHHFYQNYTILHKKRGELHNYMTTMNIFLSIGKCIYNPVVNYMFKVDSRNTRIKCKICSKLRIKTSERRLASFWYLYCKLWTCFTSCSSVSFVNLEQVNACWEKDVIN